MTQQDSQSQQFKASKQEFGIDIESIVRMFSTYLYSDPNVVIRELISNASDSCVRRKAEDRKCQAKELRLDIRYVENSIILKDTGAGMTREEIEKYLSTIGASSTEPLRNSLRGGEQGEYAGELIGKFGLGFLSAFVVAKQVVVETKSFQDDSPAYRWTCDGHQYYELEETTDYNEIGTQITLTLKPDCTNLFNASELKQLILKFSGNISLPIYFHPISSEEPVNKLAPWYRNEPPAAKECIEFLSDMDEKRFEGAKSALAVIPVFERDLDLRGVLYIPSRFQRWVSDAEGVVDVYCNRVLVRRDDLTLVPETVSIVRGCIDCPSFSLMLNREGVIQDETFSKVQKRIKDLVVSCLKNLARESKDSESESEEDKLRRSNFRYIMELHGKTLKRGALDSKDEDYFLAIAENAIFSSNKSKSNKAQYTTLPQYVKNARGNAANRKSTDPNVIVIFYNKDVQGLRQLEKVLQAQEVEILDATDAASLAFIEKFARLYKADKLEARPYEDLLEKHFKEAEPVGAWGDIIDFYHRLAHTNIEIKAKVASFDPQNVPLLIVPGEGQNDPDTAKFFEALQLLGSSQKVEKIKDIFVNHTRERTLYINVSNQLMREIKDYWESNSLDQETFDLVLHELFHSALTFANEPLDPDHLFDFHAKVIKALCDKSVQSTKSSRELISATTQFDDIRKERDSLLAQIAKLQSPGFDLEALNRQRRKVFVMRPYDANSTSRYHNCILPACQEQKLQVEDLEHRIEPGRIPEEINRHIIECAILIGDMTDASPNVMYEIGAAHMLGKENRTILIARETSTIPFDLRGFRVLTFRNDAEMWGLPKRISAALREIKHAIGVEEND
jgi:molecular chaperone HtpG